MRIIILILFLGAISQNALSQDIFPRIFPKFSVGAHRQGVFTDLSLGIRLYEEVPDLLQVNALVVFAGIENNYKFQSDFRIAPKIGLEFYHQSGYFLRVQNRLYPDKNRDFSKASWQICPEIGLEFFETFILTYGYNFPLTNKEVVPSLGHQVCLTFNVSKMFWDKY